MNIKWDSDKYDSNFSFVHQYGNALLELIDFDKAKTAIDLGCGNGALTKTLKDNGLLVVGIDGSEDQLKIAKEKYPDIRFFKGDATNFQVTNPVDLVFANAVFHWIDKNNQRDMFECIYNALKDNGQLVFELGGKGNNVLIHGALKRVFEEHGYAYMMPFYFPSIGEYSTLLESVGFEVKTAIHFDRPTELMGPDGLKDWINMFVKTPFEVVESQDEKECIVEQAVAYLKRDLFRDGKWYSDYVRLRMKAIKK